MCDVSEHLQPSYYGQMCVCYIEALDSMVS
jgi:hypothetical protein